jgi:hypothetical protein
MHLKTMIIDNFKNAVENMVETNPKASCES